jgi:hypothetical protein
MALAFAAALSIPMGASGQGTPGADGRYELRRLEGWPVYVSARLLEEGRRELCGQTLKLLGEDLSRIARAVPAPALARLREVPIWVEVGGGPTAMCYHVSAEWLRGHGMNPNKARSVEICDARLYLDWTRDQPWMVLHELAHAYHHQALGGYDQPEIAACLDSARAAKIYESVLHINGRRLRAYALNNEAEYFAEATEAFFGTNDFYPFVRAELKQHDPRLYAVLEKLWGVRPSAK